MAAGEDAVQCLVGGAAGLPYLALLQLLVGRVPAAERLLEAAVKMVVRLAAHHHGAVVGAQLADTSCLGPGGRREADEVGLVGGVVVDGLVHLCHLVGVCLVVAGAFPAVVGNGLADAVAEEGAHLGAVADDRLRQTGLAEVVGVVGVAAHLLRDDLDNYIKLCLEKIIFHD